MCANLEGGVSALYVVGYSPPWLAPTAALSGSSARSKWQVVLEHMAIAAAALKGVTALLVDDDMFALERWAPTVLHAHGSLIDHSWQKRGSYQRSLWATDAYLRELGVADPLSYELHVPLPIDCDAAVPVLEQAVSAMRPHRPMQGRSLYGNLTQIGGAAADDVKVYRGEQRPAGPLLSTGDGSWLDWHQPIARMFPHASSFER